MDMPEGIRLGIEVYMLSETLDTGSVVLATGCKELPDDLDKMIRLSIESANNIMKVTDFRVMTSEEIDGYRHLIGHVMGDEDEDTETDVVEATMEEVTTP